MTWSNRPSNVTCCLKPGWFKTTTNWEFRKPVGCEPSTPGTPGAGAKTKRCVFQQGSKWSKQKYNWRERWKEPGNYIPKFWLAHLSWKKTNDWSKVGSPFFFEVFGRINEPRNPMILLSVPMRRACRFFCFEAATKYKLKPDWYVQSRLKFEMFGAQVVWFTSPV